MVLNVLIVNDDGIDSRGLKELTEALVGKANVYVCAPDKERSGFSHSITCQHSLSAKKVILENAQIAFELSGTPADCVKIGLLLLKEKGVDINLVYSGINHGCNIGTDTLYSGTVAGAMEALINGIPGVAVSIDCSLEGFADGYSIQCQPIDGSGPAVWKSGFEPDNYEYARLLAIKMLELTEKKILTAENVININTPDLPTDKIKGIKYTSVGNRDYTEFFRHKETNDDYEIFDFVGELTVNKNTSADTDVIAIQNGFASISPIKKDRTDYSFLEKISKWGL